MNIKALIMANGHSISVGAEQITHINVSYNHRNQKFYQCFVKKEIRFEFEGAAVNGVEYFLEKEQLF